MHLVRVIASGKVTMIGDTQILCVKKSKKPQPQNNKPSGLTFIPVLSLYLMKIEERAYDPHDHKDTKVHNL